MPSKKPTDPSFKSLRIVGKKAQSLITKARTMKETPTKTTKKSTMPKAPEPDELLMHISIRSFVQGGLTILAIILGFLALYHLRDKFFLLMLGVFVAAIVDPGVSFLEKMGVPRGLAILVQYLVAIFLIFFLLFSFIPIIAEQLQSISAYLSREVDIFLANPQIAIPFVPAEINQRLTLLSQTVLQSLSITELSDALSQMGETLSDVGQGSVVFVAQLAGSVASFLVSLAVVLVLGFFIQIEKENIFKWILGFLPKEYRAYLTNKSEAVHVKIGQWARGEILLMLSIFALTFTALLILRMPYALTLAVLAGFCEFIPAVGPLIAAVPAVLIAISEGGLIWAMVVAGVYYVIQWCENNLLVPLIMRRAVGLSPIAILFAMMIGISFPDTIPPVVGVMLAIPTTTIIAVFLDDWQRLHEKK